MIISVINQTRLDDEKVQAAVRAVNRQIEGDFAPHWGFGATLRLEGSQGKRPHAQSLADMRGEAVLYFFDGKSPDDALGYHESNFRGIPFGMVFSDISQELDESWTATLSHEALELLADPEANLLVQGPHPKDRRHTVFHWFEMCDAVQDQTYRIDGVEVSNFVLPLYFTRESEVASRNDFLGKTKDGSILPSFGVTPGGYVGFFDPKLGRHTTWSRPNDQRARERQRIRAKLKLARRARRYAEFTGNRSVRSS
jgi:hypothetical protein